MTKVRRRLCRALACPRHVDNRVIFCNVHWSLIGPKLQAGIPTNEEAPANATIDGVRAVIVGTAQAVAFIAKKEGRARDHAEAARSAVVAPGAGEDTSGGAAAAVSGGSAGGIGGGASTRRLVDRS